MTEFSTKYDEECPMHEDDTWAIPFKLFSQEASLFSDFPSISAPKFVEEVFTRKEEFS